MFCPLEMWTLAASDQFIPPLAWPASFDALRDSDGVARGFSLFLAWHLASIPSRYLAITFQAFAQVCLTTFLTRFSDPDVWENYVHCDLQQSKLELQILVRRVGKKFLPLPDLLS